LKGRAEKRGISLKKKKKRGEEKKGRTKKKRPQGFRS